VSDKLVFSHNIVTTRRDMKINRIIIVITLVILCQLSYAGENAQSTRVKVGMDAPEFRCRIVAGENFVLSEEKGKVILINFFATWCGPCLAELPELEKQIFLKYKDREDFSLIAIGREHNAPELVYFKKHFGLSLPIAPDPNGKIFKKYAKNTIPRSFIVGKDGKIKLVSEGYAQSQFDKMIQVIQEELEK
jgi:peroxiredoxin